MASRGWDKFGGDTRVNDCWKSILNAFQEISRSEESSWSHSVKERKWTALSKPVRGYNQILQLGQFLERWREGNDISVKILLWLEEDTGGMTKEKAWTWDGTKTRSMIQFKPVWDVCVCEDTSWLRENTSERAVNRQDRGRVEQKTSTLMSSYQ